MDDITQKKIFAKNLNYYIDLNNKQQKEVANDLGISATTLNTWCKANAIPSLSKIQKLADYFGIGKSDLMDNKLDNDYSLDARILSDIEIVDMIKKYYKLSIKDREAIMQLINSLSRKEQKKKSNSLLFLLSYFYECCN